MPSPKPEKGKPSATYQAAQKAKRKKAPKTLGRFRVLAPTPEILQALENMSTNGPPKALMPDLITLDKLASLARINATTREIAASLRVDESTFIAFCNANPVVRQTLDANRGEGKISLRRAQWAAAVEEGSVPMMIWLGKNELGQSDKAEVSHDVNVTVLRALMELGDD